HRFRRPRIKNCLGSYCQAHIWLTLAVLMAYRDAHRLTLKIGDRGENNSRSLYSAGSQDLSQIPAARSRSQTYFPECSHSVLRRCSTFRGGNAYSSAT